MAACECTVETKVASAKEVAVKYIMIGVKIKLALSAENRIECGVKKD
jgi:hypothetical protein